MKNRVLEQQLLQAEQKKFALGASTTFNVVTQQRDLATAQSTEIATLAAYSQAHISLDQTLGTTLKTNNISVAKRRTGKWDIRRRCRRFYRIRSNSTRSAFPLLPGKLGQSGKKCLRRVGWTTLNLLKNRAVCLAFEMQTNSRSRRQLRD